MTRRRRSLIATLLVAATLAAAAEDAQAADGPGHVACEVRVGQSRRVSLADGSTLTIDPASIATNGSSVLVAGTPIHLWGPGATSESSPVRMRPAVGVIRSRTGAVRLVPAPPGVPRATYPRVASAGPAGWHFLFVTDEPGAERNALAFEETEVWYGLFDGRQWRSVERIAHARSASLLPGMSSDFVATAEGVAFAYSYDRSAALRSNAPGNQGLVLLQRRLGRWSADTLRTWEGPRAVALAALPEGGVLAAFVQTYFEAPRPRGPVLFTARYRSGWETPRIALDVQPDYVGAPMIAPAGAGTYVLAWRVLTPGASGGTLEWGTVPADGRLQRIGAVGPLEPIDRPAMVRLTGGRIAWLTRNGVSRRDVRVVVAEGTTVTGTGVVHMPLHNFAIVAAPMAGDRLLVVSGRVGERPHEPPASSYFTVIAVKCTAVRR